MRLIFVRHGETTGDVEERYGGAYDDSLSEKGIEQARALSAELHECGARVIYTSPMRRAQETAAILGEALSLTPVVIPDARERNQYAALSGMKKADAAAAHPEFVELLKDRLNTIPGAETYDEFSHRIRGAFEELLTQLEHDASESALIVWHGGPMRVLFRDILKWGELSEIGDCCFVSLEGAGDQWDMVRAGRLTLERGVQ